MALNEQETRFVEYWVQRHISRMSVPNCWRKAFPTDRNLSDQTLRKRARILMDTPDAKKAEQACIRHRKVEEVMTVGQLQEKFTEWASDSALMLRTLEIDFQPTINAKTGEIIGYRPVYVVMHPNEVPRELLPYICSFQWSLELGKFIVEPKEVYAQKERLKSAELLGRSLGAFVDKQEITGKDGSDLIPDEITHNMTDKEASEVYLKALKAASK